MTPLTDLNGCVNVGHCDWGAENAGVSGKYGTVENPGVHGKCGSGSAWIDLYPWLVSEGEVVETGSGNVEDDAVVKDDATTTQLHVTETAEAPSTTLTPTHELRYRYRWYCYRWNSENSNQSSQLNQLITV